MLKHCTLALAIWLLAGAVAQAQSTGGHGRGGRGGHSQPDTAPAPAGAAAPTPRTTPLNEVEIVGVIKAIGPEPDRVTIAYQAVDALNWPAGSKPFVVSKPTLLVGLTAGEKVRFKLESQQISDMKPF